MTSERNPPPRTLDALQAELRSNFEDLSAQFQTGARFLLDHPHEIPLLSMRKVAADAGVQPATLVRLAQSLGFEGWQGLRELFVESVRAGGGQAYATRAKNMIRSTGASRMLDDMVAAQRRNLDGIAAANEDALPKAVELLGTAENVYVAGFRACYPVAFMFHYVYRLFRPTVQLIRGEAGTFEMELRSLTSKDAVIVTSFAPYSAESVRITDVAVRAGCRIVALTDSTVSPIALRANCTLLFSAESPSFFPSIGGAVVLAEALVGQLLAKKGKRAIKALELSEEELRRNGDYVMQ